MVKHDTPRVWLGCLACYNEGSLNGEWLDADDADVLTENITARQLKCGHVDNDWYVADHEGFHGINIGEWPNFAKLEELAKNIDKHGKAFAVWIGHVGAAWDDVDGFEEAYQGEFDSERDFAYQLADDIGLLDGAPETLKTYFDWDAWTRDLFLGDYFEESGFIFRNT